MNHRLPAQKPRGSRPDIFNQTQLLTFFQSQNDGRDNIAEAYLQGLKAFIPVMLIIIGRDRIFELIWASRVTFQLGDANRDFWEKTSEFSVAWANYVLARRTQPLQNFADDILSKDQFQTFLRIDLNRCETDVQAYPSDFRLFIAVLLSRLHEKELFEIMEHVQNLYQLGENRAFWRQAVRSYVRWANLGLARYEQQRLR